MTIEFLYTRLQAQRTVYKAEKQQVQQLVKKVMELEQKLNLEIARRKKAECDNMLVSSRHGSCYIRRTCMMNKEGKEKGVTMGSSHVEGDACCTTEHHKNQIDEGVTQHTDGDEIQYCLGHGCEYHRRKCQPLPFQHCNLLGEQSNAAFNQNSSETKMQKGTRESMDSEPYSEEMKANIMLEITEMNSNTKDDEYGADSWNNAHKTDTEEELEESVENKYTSLNFQKTPGLSHRFPSCYSPRKMKNFRQLASNSSIESLNCSSLGNSRNLAFRQTIKELKCSTRAIHSPRDYPERSLVGIMSSSKKVNLGAFTDLPISSSSPQKHKLYNNRQLDECSLHEDILAERESSKEIEEDGHVARQKRKQDFEGKHGVAVYGSHSTKQSFY